MPSTPATQKKTHNNNSVYSIYSANAVDALPVVEPKGLLGPLLLKYTREHPVRPYLRAWIDRLSTVLSLTHAYTHIRANERQVAGGMSVPRYLGMPVERFPQYVAFLQILVKLDSNKGAPCPKLEAALQVSQSVGGKTSVHT